MYLTLLLIVHVSSETITRTFDWSFWQTPENTVYLGTEMEPGQLRVVVDSMLQGLGRQLRNCGVDVHILNYDNDHEKVIQVNCGVDVHILNYDNDHDKVIQVNWRKHI
jgi:hypothetical protein